MDRLRVLRGDVLAVAAMFAIVGIMLLGMQ